MTLLDSSPADFRRFLTFLVDRRLLGSQCCLSTGLVANGIRLAKRCNALLSRSDVTRGLPDLDKSRTVRNRLKSAGHKSRRVIKRSLLVNRHRRSRLAWCLARRGWNLRAWRKIHWSDESWLLLHVTDDWMRVWRHKYTAFTTRNIQPTVPYGGGSVMVWGPPVRRWMSCCDSCCHSRYNAASN
jgi:hypothetical protein